MKRTVPNLDVIHLIRFATILWIGYLVVLAIINHVFWAPPPMPPRVDGNLVPIRSDIVYYIVAGFVTLLCLGLTYWTWPQERLKRAFVPLIIALITIVPMLAIWAIVRFFPRSPMFDLQTSVLMLLPFLLVAFLLVAWQYKWLYISLIILGIAGLNLIIIWSFPPPGPEPFRGAINSTLIQTVVFLSVGFSISYLINRLRNQQRSLEAANIHLTHYASTLERLATTRERNRLAREMHDTLAHTLSGLSVQLEALKAYWDVDQQKAYSILDESLATIHLGLGETRRALKALRASPLDDLGLATATSTIVKDAVARTNMALDLSITDKIPTLSPDVEQCIYRVAQEAVTNAVNHANAKNLTVELKSMEGKVTLIVQDDGIGFDIEKNNKTSHFGLVGMKERALLIGGELTIDSKPGQGTTIKLTVNQEM